MRWTVGTLPILTKIINHTKGNIPRVLVIPGYKWAHRPELQLHSQDNGSPQYLRFKAHTWFAFLLRLEISVTVLRVLGFLFPVPGFSIDTNGNFTGQYMELRWQSQKGKNAFYMLPDRAFFLTVSVRIIDYCWERWICKPENICSLEASFSKTYLYPYMSSQITQKNNYRSIYIILILWLVDYKSMPPWPFQEFGGCVLLFLQAERMAVLPKDGQCFLKET